MRLLFPWNMLLMLAIVGFGTTIVAGTAWGDERAVNRGEAQGPMEAIRDEVQKQRALQQKLLAQGLHYSNITGDMTKEFASEIEKGRLAIFDNGAGLNIYLNETFFFTQAKSLSEEGRGLLRKLSEKLSSTKLSSTPEVLFVIEENSDSNKNHSGQNIWSLAKFLHQQIPLKPQRILVKSNGKLMNIDGRPTTFTGQAYPVRIVIISPST